MSMDILRHVAVAEIKPLERYTTVFVASVLVIMALAVGAPALAQGTAQPRVSGTFDDYVWVETGSGAGAWHVTGAWTAQLNANSGKGEFIGNLLGVRSDLWVLQTNADPANPALRTPHTHHVGLLNANVTVIPSGIRLTGNAIITTNGSVAPFSGAPVQVDITGGGLIRFSNIKLTFLGAAVEHFGPQAYDGIVVFER
jgi:hypothetical protein